MSRRILISSRDENYLLNMALKFYSKLDDNIEITLISDFGYLSEYINGGFSGEEILVIDREYYYNSLNYSLFENIVVLDEKQENECLLSENVISISKFMTFDYIYDCIAANTSLKEEVMRYTTKETRLIAVYSPIGGVGKTTISYGVCAALAKAYKKVLYINADGLQAFGELFNETGNIDSKLERYISSQDERLGDYLNELTGNYIFDYLKPTRMSLFSVGINLKNYINLISEFRKASLYDYIVIDMSSEFSGDIASLIGQCDKVICVGMQDKSSAFRLNKFIDNIDTSDSGKFMFICNKFNDSKENNLCDYTGRIKANCFIKEYIEFDLEMLYSGEISEVVMNKLEQLSIHCM